MGKVKVYQVEKYQKVVDGFQLVFFLGRIAVDVDGGATDDDTRREQLVAGRPLLDRRVPLTVEPGLAVGICKQSAKEAMNRQATILVAQVSENFHDQAKTKGYQGNSRNTFFPHLGTGQGSKTHLIISSFPVSNHQIGQK